LWETLASNSTAAADTDFTLSGSQPTNLANYYDSSLFASFRVYQQPGFAAFDKGFNFRNTSGFVTDGATETYVVGDTYPVTRNSVTFGWTNSGNLEVRDRNAAVDARFAGLNRFTDFGLVAITFRVDLPAAGTYDIRLALGEEQNARPNAYSYKILDNASTLTTISGVSLTSSAATFRDAANGGPYSIANWPGSNTAYSGVFATTTLILQVEAAGTTGGSVEVPVAHMRIVRTA
jgi:hypothetical protein